MAVTPRHPGGLYGSSGTTATIAVDMNTGSLFAAVGTIVFLFIAAQGEVAPGSGRGIGLHAEWTNLYRGVGGGTRTHSQAVFYRVIDQDDIDAPGDTISYSFSTVTAGPWDWWIMGFDGADQSDPVDTYAAAQSFADGTAVTAPSITTTRNGCRIVRCFGGTAPTPGSPTLTPVAGWRGAWGGGASDYPALGIADEAQATAGIVAAVTSTLSVSGSWHASTIALQPPATGGGWGVGMVRMGAA